MSLSYGSIGSSLQGERLLSLADNEELKTSTSVPYANGNTNNDAPTSFDDDDTSTSLGSSTLNQSNYSLVQTLDVMEQSLAKERKVNSILSTTLLLFFFAGIIYTLYTLPLGPLFPTKPSVSSAPTYRPVNESHAPTDRPIHQSLAPTNVPVHQSHAPTDRPVHKSLTTTVEIADATMKEVPFATIERGADGSNTIPAYDIVNAGLFHPSLVLPKSKKTTQPLFTFPFPTGAFWTNLVLPTAADGFTYPIMCYPYAYQWKPDTLQISYPPLRRRIDPISIRDIVNPDMIYNVVEPITSRYITKFDPLSVTMRFDVKEKESYWETYLVQGSPYATFKYVDVTPVFTPLSVFKAFACPFDEGKDHGSVGVCSTINKSMVCFYLSSCTTFCLPSLFCTCSHFSSIGKCVHSTDSLHFRWIRLSREFNF